jgi:Immunity protein 8
MTTDSNIELEIKSCSVEGHENLETWAPSAASEVYLGVEIEVGIEGEEPRDLFRFWVATPEGLRANASREIISDRNLVVVSNYSWAVVRRHIDEIVRGCRASTWLGCVAELQKFFRWEYEGYRAEEGSEEEDVEVFVEGKCFEALEAWLAAVAGPLGIQEWVGKDKSFITAKGTVIVESEPWSGGFTRVHFLRGRLIWATDEDCARQASRELGCKVRCDVASRESGVMSFLEFVDGVGRPIEWTV